MTDSSLTSSVPPPPSEVKVRTMRSDIDGIAKAGGGLPQFKTVAVEGVGLPRSRVGGPVTAIGGSTPNAASTPGSATPVPAWIIGVLIVALVFIAFFGWLIFFGGK